MFGSRHVEFQIVIIVFCEDTNHGVKGVSSKSNKHTE
jgi:hypothetical protein